MGEVRHAVEVVGDSLNGASVPSSSSPLLLQRIADLEVRLERLEGLAKRVQDDYERVRVEVELQRKVLLRFIVESSNGLPLDTLQSLEKEIRQRVGHQWAPKQKVEPGA